MEILVLKFIGLDSWRRPVYKDSSGRLWKDVDPRKQRTAELCTCMGNVLEGEPDTNMSYMEKYKNIVVEFEPGRVTW